MLERLRQFSASKDERHKNDGRNGQDDTDDRRYDFNDVGVDFFVTVDLKMVK
jgi:hypothetical protein